MIFQDTIQREVEQIYKFVIHYFYFPLSFKNKFDQK
jgi:hypothetical protein